MEVLLRNNRGDLIAVFSSPMTTEKWQQLKEIPKLSKRFQIQLPNGYNLNFGEHQNILKQNPKNFGEYVRFAYLRYFSDPFSG
ncbi:hypothetical protein FNW02_36605 [Komarekiella sp. 'clone 1']|uniref:Uncharacterized protein n=1 Tax=Komarekiella delphini-convector SJRDD-AB1 TaxID=2593771 RepID=A0AA40VVK3_9NOST|nr:hypothetical protein [Komarekiella delphini-convector]MBD6621089.1 hypothetical protein [Komarekiella delphini-convector SJRDD-AB1]